MGDVIFLLSLDSKGISVCNFLNLSMTCMQTSVSCVLCKIFSVHNLLMRISLVSLGSATFSCNYGAI